MTRLSGAEAEARLGAVWETVFRADPAPQRIVHVLAPPAGTERPAWLDGFAAYEAWERDGSDDGDLARFEAERGFVTAVRDLAPACGDRVDLPRLPYP